MSRASAGTPMKLGTRPPPPAPARPSPLPPLRTPTALVPVGGSIGSSLSGSVKPHFGASRTGPVASDWPVVISPPATAPVSRPFGMAVTSVPDAPLPVPVRPAPGPSPVAPPPEPTPEP